MPGEGLDCRVEKLRLRKDKESTEVIDPDLKAIRDGVVVSYQLSVGKTTPAWRRSATSAGR